jgi:hypothetical protein
MLQRFFVERSDTITVTSVLLACSQNAWKLRQLGHLRAFCPVLDHASRTALRVKPLAMAKLPAEPSFDVRLSKNAFLRYLS